MPAPIRSLSSTSRRSGARDGAHDINGGSSRRINIDISGPDGIIVTLYAPVDMLMQKILKKYCELKFLDYQSMGFSYKGRRVQVRRTVDELHMVEGDQVDSFVRVFPGARDDIRRIYINIAGPDGILVTYYLPVDVPMHKLLKKYCEHRQLEYSAMIFLDNRGTRIQVRRTIEELHIADGGQIDAYYPI